MGIHDRDYGRAPEAGFYNSSAGGGSGIGYGRRGFGFSNPAGWSFTTWIIVINIIVFVVDQLFIGMQKGIVVKSAGMNVLYPPLEAIGHFSVYTALYKFQIWRFVTFQFLHAGILHIAFNMYVLYLFGTQVEQYLGSRRYLVFYLLTGCAGAVFYLILNVAGNKFGGIPFLLPGNIYVPLVGASAGIFGVLMAVAYLRPNQIILLWGLLPMKVRTLAYGLVILALFMIISKGNNAGGEAGHLGGALLGFWLIRHTNYLNWALWVPFIGGMSRSKTTGHRKGFQDMYSGPGQNKKSRKVPNFFNYGKKDSSGSSGATGKSTKGKVDDAEVDRILSKVATQGLHSLTDKEKKTLQNATEEKRGK